MYLRRGCGTLLFSKGQTLMIYSGPGFLGHRVMLKHMSKETVNGKSIMGKDVKPSAISEVVRWSVKKGCDTSLESRVYEKP